MSLKAFRVILYSVVPIMCLMAFGSACRTDELSEDLVMCDFGEDQILEVPRASCVDGTIVNSRTGPIFEP